jgi:DNA-directed RNA polymerase subunit K
LKGEKYTRYERARIVGARALQVFMGAPVYINTESIDPLEIALEEMRLGVIPITVKRDRRTSR